MARFRRLYAAFAPLALLTALSSSTAAPQPKAPQPLSLEEVVKLCQAGFTEEVIVTKIKKNGKPFDLSTEELLDLRKAGVGDNIINYLLDPNLPYTPPPPPAPPAPPPAADKATDKAPAVPPPVPVPVKKYPPDPFASKTPPEVGLYRFPSDSPVALEMKILLGSKEGPGLGKVLMKKGDVVAFLPGASSSNRAKDPNPRFYLRLPEGKGIEEVVLIALLRKSDRREIDMGSGPKPEIKPEVVRQFDSLEVGPHLFRITTSKLAKGEYLFFLLGSAEAPKGSYGKGYDFGID